MYTISRQYICYRLALILVPLCAGCAAVSRDAPHELLDERTGVTLIVVGQPLILARQRTDVAVNSRDYATLVGVEVDRSGNYTPYLIVYRWSTVDRRMAPLPASSMGHLLMQVDGREIDLTPLAGDAADVLLRQELLAPRTPQAIGWTYSVDLATLLYIADSKEMVLRFPDDPYALPFIVWSDARAALREFAQRGVLR